MTMLTTVRTHTGNHVVTLNDFDAARQVVDLLNKLRAEGKIPFSGTGDFVLEQKEAPRSRSQ
jgi:hypothetical protein